MASVVTHINLVGQIYIQEDNNDCTMAAIFRSYITFESVSYFKKIWDFSVAIIKFVEEII